MVKFLSKGELNSDTTTKDLFATLKQNEFYMNANFIIYCDYKFEIWSGKFESIWRKHAIHIFVWLPKIIVNVCLMKILKSIVTKKVIVCFYNLGEENF